MTRTRGSDQRGFTLIVVVMIVAVLAMVAVSLLNLIRLDLTLVGQSRRNIEARVIADGAAMEIINDVNINSLLPTLAGSLVTAYTPPAASPFNNASEGRVYTGNLSLLRIVPLPESSHGWSMAVVYEVDTTSIYNGGESSSEVRSEIYKVVSKDPAIQLPSRHAR